MKPPAVVANLWPVHTPVLEAFLARYGRATIVSIRPVPEHVRDMAAARGCPIVTIDGLLPRGYSREVESAAVLALLRAHLNGVDWLPSDLGGPGVNEMRPLIERALAGELPEAVRALDALEVVRARYNIVLLVTTEDVTRIGRPVTAWAVAHGIPSLHIAHSTALVDPTTVHAHLVADRLAVYGQRGAEGYLDLGINPSRIVITGNPAWDEYSRMVGRRAEIRAELVAKHGLDPALPLVVFGTTGGGHQTALEPAGDVNLTSLQAFVDACGDLAADGFGINAVVKDRPNNAALGEAALARALAAAGLPRRLFVRTGDDTREFAVAADILIAVDSNYLVEAMLAGTVAINLVSDRLALFGPTFEEECGVIEAQPHELAASIRRLIEDDAFRTARQAQGETRRQHYNLGGTDGRSTERVGALMASMARPPRRLLVRLGDVYRRGRRLARRAKRRVLLAFRGGTT